MLAIRSAPLRRSAKSGTAAIPRAAQRSHRVAGSIEAMRSALLSTALRSYERSYREPSLKIMKKILVDNPAALRVLGRARSHFEERPREGFFCGAAPLYFGSRRCSDVELARPRRTNGGAGGVWTVSAARAGSDMELSLHWRDRCQANDRDRLDQQHDIRFRQHAHAGDSRRCTSPVWRTPEERFRTGDFARWLHLRADHPERRDQPAATRVAAKPAFARWCAMRS